MASNRVTIAEEVAAMRVPSLLEEAAAEVSIPILTKTKKCGIEW